MSKQEFVACEDADGGSQQGLLDGSGIRKLSRDDRRISPAYRWSENIQSIVAGKVKDGPYARQRVSADRRDEDADYTVIPQFATYLRWLFCIEEESLDPIPTMSNSSLIREFVRRQYVKWVRASLDGPLDYEQLGFDDTAHMRETLLQLSDRAVVGVTAWLLKLLASSEGRTSPAHKRFLAMRMSNGVCRVKEREHAPPILTQTAHSRPKDNVGQREKKMRLPCVDQLLQPLFIQLRSRQYQFTESSNGR